MSALPIAHRWFNAFNDHSTIDLLALYDDEAEHFSPRLLKLHPETKGLIKGKAEMYKWWQSAFERLPSLKYTIVELREENDRVFMAYIRSVDSEEDMIVNEMLQIRDNLIVLSKVI